VHATAYIPLAIAAGLTERDLEEGSLFDAFARITGVSVARSRQTMAPIVASAALARLLRVPRGTPHLRFTGMTLLADGRVAELTRSVFRGDLFEFVADMRRDPASPEPPRGAATRRGTRQGQPNDEETVP
jgi:GntR family transcriptional regulator